MRTSTDEPPSFTTPCNGRMSLWNLSHATLTTSTIFHDVLTICQSISGFSTRSTTRTGTFHQHLQGWITTSGARVVLCSSMRFCFWSGAFICLSGKGWTIKQTRGPRKIPTVRRSISHFVGRVFQIMPCEYVHMQHPLLPRKISMLCSMYYVGVLLSWPLDIDAIPTLSRTMLFINHPGGGHYTTTEGNMVLFGKPFAGLDVVLAAGCCFCKYRGGVAGWNAATHLSADSEVIVGKFWVRASSVFCFLGAGPISENVGVFYSPIAEELIARAVPRKPVLSHGKSGCRTALSSSVICLGDPPHNLVRDLQCPPSTVSPPDSTF